ncbi:MAG TPA: iron-sulfur cluster repair di-iron protein [Flavobacteriales bacterium]|nr:iron-sulfur cluster repair di-iron protein [Flavobacteriales bacterium]HMR27472.1 iron-sulfur cluster repair di-iron protein [Flavobacteriales bacterium]
MTQRTVGSIVADDYRTAAVFNAHGIDFCCKGGRTIAEVCRAKAIEPDTLEAEIRQAIERDGGTGDDVRQWPLSRLIGHIERVHHRYVEARSTTLKQFLNKLCSVHGDRHPELLAIREEFETCTHAMATHMKKEELVLFPFINQLERSLRHDLTAPTPHFGTVDNPIAMMEREHDAEGERFRRIAILSRDYTSPPDGCTTYATAYAMLREFEEDLHRHIHLENNILFPKAKALEKELRRAQGCDAAAC